MTGLVPHPPAFRIVVCLNIYIYIYIHELNVDWLLLLVLLSVVAVRGVSDNPHVLGSGMSSPYWDGHPLVVVCEW